MNGGRFDFDDGGTYVGGWEEQKAHGHGVCTGPQAKGEYAGAWHYGFEVSGVYTWPSGNTYQGQWQNGKRHGLGLEQRGRWIYRGEWTQGFKGRYGARQSGTSQAKYQGTWSAGFHDGYGTETYVDGGTYQGQWLRGMRHGYGIRKSTTYANAAKFRPKTATNASLTSLRSGRIEEDAMDDHHHKANRSGRGGFVLRANVEPPQRRRRSLSERSLAVKRTLLSGLRIKKQHSTGDIHQRVTSMTGSLRSSGSTMSCTSEDSLHPHGLGHADEPIEDSVIEVYMGEWKNDARSGFGICERSDGLKYHGEWVNNVKNGYGMTIQKDGTVEEGRYKNNVLVTSTKRKGGILFRNAKCREKVDQALNTAARAASIAQQKSDIAESRTSTARERAEQAAMIAAQACGDSDLARIHAKQFDPSFRQPGIRRLARENNGGESFGTDLSDAISSTRHLSQQHTNQHSFEQNLSVDLGDDMPSTSYHNHIIPPQSNHIQQQLQPGVYHPQQYLHQHQQQYGYLDPNGQLVHDPHHLPPQPNLIANQIPNQNPQYHQEHPSVLINHQESHEHQQQQQTSESVDQQEAEKPLTLGPNPPATPKSNMMTTQAPPNVMSSRFSLSDDHYDQYVMAGGSAAAAAAASNNQQPSKLRRNRPSLMRQADVNETSSSSTSQQQGGGFGINRRSTLASARDRNGDVTTPISKLKAAAATADGDNTNNQDNMGSLPNLAQLETQGVRMRREEAARLAGQRRQEVLRENEEQELLRANPLRHLLQPAFRAWLIRWRVPILLAIANISLLCLFYNLLTYEKKNKKSTG